MSLITLVRAVLFPDPNIPEEYGRFSGHCILILNYPLNVFNHLVSTVLLSPIYAALLHGRLFHL